MLNEKDVGSYYVDENNTLYQMIGYCPFPTVIMQDVRTGQKEHVVKDCLNAESYHKLIKELPINSVNVVSGKESEGQHG